MVSLRAAALVVIAALVAAACDSGPKADPPTGEHELVLQMVELGGLMPPDELLKMPEVSVFGGGLVVISTPAGPMQRQLTAAGVQKISQAAANAGLVGKVDGRRDDIVDGPVTTFAVVSGGQRSFNEITLPGGRIARLRDDLYHLDDFLGKDIGKETVPYVPSKLAVWAYRDPHSTGVRVWELNDLATAGETDRHGRCQVLTGDAVTRFAGEKSGESWKNGIDTYHVGFRPMLPDEVGCPWVELFAR